MVDVASVESSTTNENGPCAVVPCPPPRTSVAITCHVYDRFGSSSVLDTIVVSRVGPTTISSPWIGMILTVYCHGPGGSFTWALRQVKRGRRVRTVWSGRSGGDTGVTHGGTMSGPPTAEVRAVPERSITLARHQMRRCSGSARLGATVTDVASDWNSVSSTSGTRKA